MRDYLNFYAIRGQLRTESEKITIASSYLVNQAKAKWTVAKRCSDNPNTPLSKKILSLEDFFTHIYKANTSWKEQELIRHRYMTLTQRKSAGDFGTEHINLSLLLNPSPPGNEVLEQFKSGLKNGLRKKMARIVDPPLELQAYITLCDRIDKRIYQTNSCSNTCTFSQTPGYGQRTQHQQRFHQQNRMSNSTPRFNAMFNQQRPGPTNSSATSNSNFTPSRGSSEWKSWCRNNNLCLECGKSGHRAATCRYKQGNGKGRQDRS